MTELSPDEKDLLERVRNKQELKPLFLRKIKGLKWFETLDGEGYFAAETIPEPRPSEQEGFWIIPPWGIGDYLVKTVSELTNEKDLIYAPRFLKIISNATAYAREHSFGNYRVWYQFAQVASQIPSRFVEEEFLKEVVDYWLDDRFEKSLIAEEIAEKWFVELLKERNDHAFGLALGLLDILYKVETAEGEDVRNRIFLRSGKEVISSITDEIVFLSGSHLGVRAVSVFHSRFEETLEVLGNDLWSSVWQPSIAESHGEDYFFDPENILLKAYRECLGGWFESSPHEASEYVDKMMESSFQTIQRLAIHFITHQFQACGEYAEKLIDERFFEKNYEREFWRFLKRSYAYFNPMQKSRIVELIKRREPFDKGPGMLEISKAYEEAFWFAAIKDSDEQAECLYEKAVSVAGAEPQPPDSSRLGEVKVGWITQESEHPNEELSLLSTRGLAQRLRAGDVESARAVKPLIKASPLNYYSELEEFKDLRFTCLYAVTRAYCELWKEKAALPWDDIWSCLLEFFSDIVGSDRFKNDTCAPGRSEFVSAVAEFLESGAWSDDHAFDEKHHAKVESVIACILENEKGVEFKETEDKVTTAINSPRARCIQALINLTLRSCRLSRKGSGDDHSGVWEKFQHYYDAELKKADSGEFEFSTLVTVYLPNFLYMSRQWVLSSLGTIFSKEDYMRWLCAMEGYYYSGMPDKEVYEHLSINGDLLKALDDENIMHRVRGRVIENAASAYIRDLENLGEGGNKSMVKSLVDRGAPQELNILIHFMTNLGKKGYLGVKDKIFELWPLLIETADFSTREGRALASNLCAWSIFVDDLDGERMELLLKIAPYADESHTPRDLLQSLARLSEKQPFKANEIWLKILARAAPTYPEGAIRQILSNLISRGEEGKRAAEKTVDEYIKKGVETPSRLLRELNKS